MADASEPRPRRVGAVLVAGAVALASGCGGAVRQRGELPTARGVMAIEVVATASGATRLTWSPAGRYLVAELGGAWIDEAFADSDAVPPVFALLDGGTGAVVATGNGWVLGPPTDDGDVAYVEEHGEEYRYRVRSLRHPARIGALAPRDDGAVLVAAMRAGDRLVAVRGVAGDPGRDRPSTLWLAAIDPVTLATTATTTATDAVALGPGDHPFAASAIGPCWLATPADDDGWAVTCLDATTLTPRWRAPVPARAAVAAGARAIRHATLVATDDGRHLAIVDGGVAPAGVEVEAVHVLDAGDGHLIGTVPAPPALTTAVAVVAAVPGRDALALLQRYRHEVHGDRFAAVTVVDLAGGGVIDTLDVARTALGDRYEATRDLAPSTLACGPDLTVALAPHDDHFDGGGLQTSSVRGLVTTPADWHQPDRPRVRARAAARAARDGR